MNKYWILHVTRCVWWIDCDQYIIYSWNVIRNQKCFKQNTSMLLRVVINNFFTVFKSKSVRFVFTSSEYEWHTDNIIMTTTKNKNVFIHVNVRLTRFSSRHGTNDTCPSCRKQSVPLHCLSTVSDWRCTYLHEYHNII